MTLLSRLASPTITEKKMSNRLVSSVAAAALTVAGAFAAQAADLPTRKEAPAPVFVPPPFSWTGFYIGGNIGGVWESGSRSINFFSGATDSWLGAYFPNTLGSSDGGWLVGGQAGYNYQWGAWVFGVETDFDWTSLNRNFNTVSNPILAGTGIPAILVGDQIYAHGKFDLNWLGTTRGRIGFVATPDNRLMFYGTGGVAYAGGSSSFSIYDLNQGLAWGGNPSSSRTGWTIGAGAEYAWTNNITFKAEYLYVDLGSRNFTTIGNLAATTLFPDVYATAHVNYNLNVFRVGVNYKF